MSDSVYTNGVLRQEWDDNTRTYSEYDESGTLIEGMPRPYNSEENARADASLSQAMVEQNKVTVQQNLAADLTEMQNILAQTNATLRDDPSQEIKSIARAVRRLTRAALGDYSGTE